VIIKMGKARYAWVTILPLTWLTIVTMTAGFEKIYSRDPKLGFLSHRVSIEEALASGRLPAGAQNVADAYRIMRNDWIDAAVAAFFLISVVVVLVASLHEWFAVLSGRRTAVSTEIPYTPSRTAA
jgi:carbon starvation protein